MGNVIKCRNTHFGHERISGSKMSFVYFATYVIQSRDYMRPPVESLKGANKQPSGCLENKKIAPEISYRQ